MDASLAENDDTRAAHILDPSPPPPAAAEAPPSKSHHPSSCMTIITLVLNGMAFLDYQLQEILKLWLSNRENGTSRCLNGGAVQWHIVEGLAMGRANHRKPYSTESIPNKFHVKGLSSDGTTSWLDTVQQQYPELVYVHRRCDKSGCAWRDKIQMLNYLMGAIQEETILVEIDVDELWTAEQLLGIRNLLLTEDGSRDCAYFDCHFMVGQRLLTLTPGGYGHSYNYEWLRAWRYRPGMFWLSHAPPVLMAVKEDSWTSLDGELF